MKTVDEQCGAMEALYPNLRLRNVDERLCIWRGVICAYRKSYLIDVQYRVPYAVENFSIFDIQPRVQVLRPILERHSEFEEGPIPHVYGNKKTPWLPYLCLFDADVPEWTPADLLAEKTIPWTERWLVNYEFWLATGEWAGGGRHWAAEDNDMHSLKLAS